MMNRWDEQFFDDAGREVQRHAQSRGVVLAGLGEQVIEGQLELRLPRLSAAGVLGGGIELDATGIGARNWKSGARRADRFLGRQTASSGGNLPSVALLAQQPTDNIGSLDVGESLLKIRSAHPKLLRGDLLQTSASRIRPDPIVSWENTSLRVLPKYCKKSWVVVVVVRVTYQ